MSTRGITVSVVVDAARIVGGISKLANILGVRRQTFYQWRRVPSVRVLAIEAATDGKVSRHEIRPDLYPEDHAGAA